MRIYVLQGMNSLDLLGKNLVKIKCQSLILTYNIYGSEVLAQVSWILCLLGSHQVEIKESEGTIIFSKTTGHLPHSWVVGRIRLLTSVGLTPGFLAGSLLGTTSHLRPTEQPHFKRHYNYMSFLKTLIEVILFVHYLLSYKFSLCLNFIKDFYQHFKNIQYKKQDEKIEARRK